MKIGIIGADGQLGSDLMLCLEDQTLYPFVYPEMDITQVEETRSRLLKYPLDILINTAAYNRVDDAEAFPYECFNLNAFALRNLVQICEEKKIVFVHFSSDYVFDGRKESPYHEKDHPRPLSAYGVSKLAGEIFIQNSSCLSYIIRTCGLFGKAGSWGKGMNFIDRMLSLGEGKDPIRVVNDQWITPTSTVELALIVKELIQTGKFGLYHLTNEGECTWFEFAREIFRLTSMSPRLIAVDSASYGAKAVRPRYSVLENRKAKEIGLRGFSHWSQALKDYLVLKGHLTI